MTHSSSRGLTLIEVLIVVVIMGIMVTISLPNVIRWLHAYRLQAATVKLVNDLQATKLLAILKGKDHQVQIKLAEEGNYYQIVEDPKGIDRIVHSIGRVLLDKEFGGVIIKCCTFPEQNGEITMTFSPRGTSRNGRVILENSAQEQTEIVVYNGRVRVE
ncbi:hypothetical protein CSA56_14025 [candidate division KSB3 bacterium]|uniref:General secretion pathway GspH domain-containing protein n=1 Tax=candidate division KSB3 bacterium TaxID=2044937 RepID=A0A2G6KBR9_9BACT|nr:MAG: hypothetical protein CSA56_14025 [candidate division KSB3 bacterium]